MRIPLLALLAVLWLKGSCNEETSTCEVLAFDADSLPANFSVRLGAGPNLYIYSSLSTPSSQCTGAVTSVQFCYASRPPNSPGTEPDSSMREIATILLGERTSKKVRDVIPIQIDEKPCENQIPHHSGYHLCCVNHSIDPNLTFQAQQDSQLDFLVAVRTVGDLTGIILPATRGGTRRTAYGCIPHSSEASKPYAVGSTLPDCVENSSIDLGLISFLTAGDATDTSSEMMEMMQQRVSTETIDENEVPQEPEREPYYIIGLAALGTVSLVLAFVSCMLTAVVIAMCRSRARTMMRQPFSPSQEYSRLGRQASTITEPLTPNPSNQPMSPLVDGYNTLERNKKSNQALKPNAYEEIDEFDRRMSYVMVPTEDSMCVNPLYARYTSKK